MNVCKVRCRSCMSILLDLAFIRLSKEKFRCMDEKHLRVK